MSSVASTPRVRAATPWPEADALFRSDPRWLGGDDASSIELEPGRTVWLFGDSFVAVEGRTDRASAAFVRNSIGIQDGADPSSARMTFHWADGPASFFEAPEGSWYWPLHGALVADGLLLFMMRVRSPVGGTGGIDEWRMLGPLGFFEVYGWTTILVDNPHADPPSWNRRVLSEHAGPPVLGASVLARDEWLLGYGWDERKHLFLARWPRGGAASASAPQWWTGEGWSGDFASAAVVIERGATEFTIHETAGALCHTQLTARDGTITMRWAEAAEGPWTEAEPVFVPEEDRREDAFVYAAKAHPQLTGADVVLTYASNADVDVCLTDQTLYYPRFVRVSLEDA